MKPDTIFINIPVKDLNKSVEFYSKLGFTPHPVFRGKDAVCMCISEHINLMLQTESNFKQFVTKPISDPATSNGLLLCLHCDSPAQVDDIVSKAVNAGGKTDSQARDLGFLYTHGFTDPDGYIWKMNHVYPDAKIPH
jgi:predicted lactoylglutathione lyase